MHLAFTTYGIKNFADFILEDLNHKYLHLRIYKKGKKDKYILVQVQIRVIPFGIYELVFPKEYLIEILSALKIKNNRFDKMNKRIMGIKPLNILRKVLNLKPIPKFKEINHPNFPMPEYMKFVGIVPIGIREDREITEEKGKFKGWKHEGI